MMEFPEKDELVIVNIRKILPYGAFCILPEYNNMEAFLHVSEVAPRWIKNIHEFLSEGQQHVAKIYRLDREKNQVDISLKRVSEEEKKGKLEIIRTEKRAAKLRLRRLEELALEAGIVFREEFANSILGNETNRLDASTSAYASALLDRIKGFSDGPAVLALWRDFSWTRSGAPIRNFKLSAEQILDAESRLVSKLLPMF